MTKCLWGWNASRSISGPRTSGSLGGQAGHGTDVLPGIYKVEVAEAPPTPRALFVSQPEVASSTVTLVPGQSHEVVFKRVATDAGKAAAQNGLDRIAGETFKGLTTFGRADGGGHPKGCNSVPDLGWAATGGAPLSDSLSDVTEWNSNRRREGRWRQRQHRQRDGQVGVLRGRRSGEGDQQQADQGHRADGPIGTLATTTPWVLELTSEVSHKGVPVKGSVKLEWRPSGFMRDDGTVSVDDSEQR